MQNMLSFMTSSRQLRPFCRYLNSSGVKEGFCVLTRIPILLDFTVYEFFKAFHPLSEILAIILTLLLLHLTKITLTTLITIFFATTRTVTVWLTD